MRWFLALAMILVLLVTSSGCQTILKKSEDGQMPATERPDDFNLTLSWYTGHMADEADMYSYGITIGPTVEGLFTYRSGDQIQQLSESFTISNDELDLFYKKLLEMGAISNDWQMGDPIDGGPMFDLSIVAGGRHYAFPLYSETVEDERKLIDEVLKEAEALVPDVLWTEMERLRILSYDGGN